MSVPQPKQTAARAGIHAILIADRHGGSYHDTTLSVLDDNGVTHVLQNGEVVLAVTESVDFIHPGDWMDHLSQLYQESIG